MRQANKRVEDCNKTEIPLPLLRSSQRYRNNHKTAAYFPKSPVKKSIVIKNCINYTTPGLLNKTSTRGPQQQDLKTCKR